MLNKLKKNQFFWNAVKKLSVFFPKGKFRAMPSQILVELTNSCNLRCPVCPTYFAMKRPRGFMDFKLFKSIIDEFKDAAKKPGIYMMYAGEPILHPRVAQFVEYAAKNGYKTFISTNATVLTENLSEKLIKAGLSDIHLCIEGLTKESHETYRVGSNFETVKRNIEKFLSIKKELKSKTPFSVIQTLLTSFSENEIDNIAEWAKKSGADAINFKTFSMGSHTTDEVKKQYEYLLPAKRELRRKTSGVNRTLCSLPMRTSVIYWDGELGLCCVDFNNEIKLGGVLKKGFRAAYFSDEAVNKRKLGFRKKFDLCEGCSIGNADSLGYYYKF